MFSMSQATVQLNSGTCQLVVSNPLTEVSRQIYSISARKLTSSMILVQKFLNEVVANHREEVRIANRTVLGLRNKDFFLLLFIFFSFLLFLLALLFLRIFSFSFAIILLTIVHLYILLLLLRIHAIFVFFLAYKQPEIQQLIPLIRYPIAVMKNIIT